jgi:hypothetical protein
MEEINMRMQCRVILRVALLALVPLFATQISHAQITNEIQATISHPFVIANTTLPPGKYNFRMLSGTGQSAMIASRADGGTTVEFLVRDAYDSHVPQHTELVFNRYGHKEFLHKIFEGGRRSGVAAVLVSREERRLEKRGEHAFTHTETQQ